MNKSRATFVLSAFVTFAFIAMLGLLELQHDGSFGGADASFAFSFIALVMVFGFVVYLASQWNDRG